MIRLSEVGRSVFSTCVHSIHGGYGTAERHKQQSARANAACGPRFPVAASSAWGSGMLANMRICNPKDPTADQIMCKRIVVSVLWFITRSGALQPTLVRRCWAACNGGISPFGQSGARQKSSGNYSISSSVLAAAPEASAA